MSEVITLPISCRKAARRTCATSAPSSAAIIVACASAADLGHAPRGALELLTLVDLVLLLFVGDCRHEDVRKLAIGGTSAHRAAQIPLVDREKARSKLTVSGQADAVAGHAERLADGVDEPDLSHTIGKSIAPRCRGGLGVDRDQRHQVSLKDCLDL